MAKVRLLPILTDNFPMEIIILIWREAGGSGNTSERLSLVVFPARLWPLRMFRSLYGHR